jgi:hypothetical protein
MLMTQAQTEFATELPECERDDIYLPSPEEIREACQAIQSEWTESERARRARGQAGRRRGVVVTSRRFARLLLDRSSWDGRAA